MYITAYLAPGLQATGQNLMYCIGQGVARVFGGVLGGVIETQFGTTGGMYNRDFPDALDFNRIVVRAEGRSEKILDQWQDLYNEEMSKET